MTTLNNKPQYSVIAEVDNEQGESRYYVEFFPKSRQGLNDAYKYALSQTRLDNLLSSRGCRLFRHLRP